jgi:recombinational DNA repair ATPase RecF
MEIHRKNHGFYPVFLVDDAEAELDEQRLNIFLKYLSQRTQTFLTSAKGFLLTAIAEKSSHFEVKNGMILPPMTSNEQNN